MLRQWFIDEFVGGEDGIDSPYIGGFCESPRCCVCALLLAARSLFSLRAAHLLAWTVFDDNWGRTGASEMDVHNVEDAGLTPAEQQDMAAAWRVNTAAVGEAVLAKGGFAVPYFIGMPRNVRTLRCLLIVLPC